MGYPILLSHMPACRFTFSEKRTEPTQTSATQKKKGTKSRTDNARPVQIHMQPPIYMIPKHRDESEPPWLYATEVNNS